MTTIKVQALRDKRPKTEPINVETTKGNTVTFVNPVKRKGRDGLAMLKKLSQAQAREDLEEVFNLLAENGADDIEVFYDDDDATLEDLLDITRSVTKAFEEQNGSLGE